VFRKLEKTTIKNYKKKNVVSILSTSISKFLKNIFLATKNKYIFNIRETTNIESIEYIEAILEFQNSKKTKLDFRESNSVVKKRKVQQLSIKYITNI